jgi:hypothetical protein
MSLQRPDIFLTDKYLKYFGWMMHDKDHRVRRAALGGLLAPFRAVQDAAEGKARKVGDENLMIEKIDLGKLEQVVAKFLPRIVDSVLDPVGSVQEVAMNLMLVLLKGGFLDDVNDDKLWDQTNQRCLAEDAVGAIFARVFSPHASYSGHWKLTLPSPLLLSDPRSRPASGRTLFTSSLNSSRPSMMAARMRRQRPTSGSVPSSLMPLHPMWRTH